MIKPEHVGATITTSGVQSGGMFSFALGALFIAFVVYVTARGELPKYLSFFLITPATGSASTTSAPATGGATSAPATSAPATSAPATSAPATGG